MGHRGLEQVTTEERKLATILFADIVGSTAPVASEDPEIVRRTLSRAFAEMRQVLTEHGGTVEKFIGDAVMAVFGVPQAHDDDADRAVRAALALRARLAELSKTLPYELRLRIGVNTGQVVAGTQGAETLVTGEPVTAAARLQQGAAPNEILVGTATRKLTQAEIRYGVARSVEAKGLGEIEGHPAEAAVSVVPRRTRGLGELRAPLIGRDAELRLLRDSFAGSGAGRAARLVTVYGEPGVGKSRLAAEFVDIVGPDRVLRGRCLPYGSGVTYWPLLEMIRSCSGIEPSDPPELARDKLRRSVVGTSDGPGDDAEAVERRVSVVAGLTSAEASLPELRGADLGRELRWGVRRYLERRAATGSLALVFDDIQWAEEPMLVAIEHLAERSRAPLFIVCLARPELRERRWAGGLPNATALLLEPLGPADTRTLIRRLLDVDDLPARLRDEVAARAQGNPLYVEEFLRMLLEAGHVVRRDGRSIAATDLSQLPVPATLQGVLAARLDQLPAPVKRTLQVASVIGEVFYPEALTALADGDGATDEALLTGARHDLVLESDERGIRGRPYAFKHILIRDAAYDSLPKEERSTLHDRFAQWLADAVPDRRDELAALRAHHAFVAYRLATEIRAPLAAELGRRALDLVLDAARTSRRGGDVRAQYELHRRAAEIADAVGADLAVRAEATGFAARYAYDLEGQARLAELEAAIELSERAGPSRILVELLLAKAKRLVVSDLAAATALYDRAIEVAEAHGDREAIAIARADRRWPPHYVGDLEAESGILLDAYRYVVEAGVPRGFDLFRGADGYLWALHWNAISRGDFDRVARWHREIVEVYGAHARSELARSSVPLFVEAWRAGLAGDHDAAARAAARLCEDDREFGAPPYILAAHELWRGAELYAARRYDEALEPIRTAVDMLEALGYPGFTGDSRQMLARAQLKLGLLEDARRSAETADREIEPNDAVSRCRVLTGLAMVRAAEGRAVEAERLFRAALVVAAGYRFTAMESQREFIEFLLAEGRADDARPLARELVAFFDHPVAAGQRREAEELLRRCEEMATIR